MDDLFLTVLEAGECKIKALADSVSGEDLLPDSLMAVFLLCPHKASLVAQTVKRLACNAGDWSSIPGPGRFPGEDGNPLQYSRLENPMDRGAW